LIELFISLPTEWCKIVFEIRQSKYSIAFVEPEVSLPCSQQPSTGNPFSWFSRVPTFAYYFSKIRFNIILPSTKSLPCGLSPSGFPTKCWKHMKFSFSPRLVHLILDLNTFIIKSVPFKTQP
jgi:hypothetical protein